MTKKDEKNEKTTVKTETPTENATPEQAEMLALRKNLANLQTAYDEKCAECDSLKSELNALKQAQKPPEPPSDTRESVWVRSASGADFWRCGILFTSEWQEVKRAEINATAWQRITSEPALQIKQAD